MKGHMKKLFAGILSLVMVCSLPVDTLTYAKPIVTDPASATSDLSVQQPDYRVEYASHAPVWMSETDDEVSVQYAQNDTIATYADTMVSFQSKDKLYAYLCEQMLNRSAVISVSIPIAFYNELGLIGMINAATAYTEACSGQEGDALKTDFSGISYRVQGRIFSDHAECTYTMSYLTTLAQEQELTAEVKSAMESLQLDGKTESQKVVLIHDYICNHVNYDYNSSDMLKYTSYAALCKGKAVCNGYALLFYRMCKEAGLSVRIISGIGNGGLHAWNIVRIGDVYYNVDCTWDGQDDVTFDNYLLLSEKDFSVDHTRDEAYTTDSFLSMYPMALVSYFDQEKSFDAPLNIPNWNYSNISTMDKTVTTKAQGRPKLLIYFSTQCGYSQATISGLAERKYEGLDIIASAVNTTDYDAVTDFQTKYGNDDMTFTHKSASDSAGASTQMWNYVYMYTQSSSIYFPVLVYIDENDVVQHVTTGYQGLSAIEDNLEHYVGISDDQNGYTITYNSNGAGAESVKKSYPMKQTATIMDNSFTRSGYTFTGWNTREDGSGVTYKPGNVVSNPKSNLILFAQWTKIQTIKLSNVKLGTFANTKDGVKINWNAVANAKNYRVYRKEAGTNWNALTSTATGTSYTDRTAVQGKTYYYTVRALNGSAISPSYDATRNILCVKTLSDVTLKTFTNTKDGVQITWNAVTNAKKYRVYRKAVGEKNWKIVTSNATQTAYTDSTAEEGTTYYYTVRALNDSVISPSYDATKSISCVKKLADVTLGAFSNTVNGVKITWKAVPNAKNYRVYRKVAGGKWEILTSSATGTGYTDRTAVSGKTYYYTLRARNDSVFSASYDGTKKITCKR